VAVKNLGTASVDIAVEPYAVLNSALYFRYGGSIWRSDGTSSGTASFWTPPALPGLNLGQPMVVNAALYWTASFIDGGSLIRSGLWTSDGTGPGTVQLIAPQTSYRLITSMAGVGGTLYLAERHSSGIGTWLAAMVGGSSVDVASFGNQGPLSSLTNVNGSLFFNTNCPNAQLWTSDGTTAGTVMVKDIHDNPGLTQCSGVDWDLTEVNGTLFFSFLGLWAMTQ
jgi:ELWxxDGT repeat protein